MSARRPVGGTAQGGAKGVRRILDDAKAMAVGDRADAVPIGQVADQVGHEQGRGVGRDQGLDARRVDVVGAFLDVDECRHESGAQQRRNRRRIGEGGRNHLGTGREVEDFDREVERRGARIHHQSEALVEQCRHFGLQLAHSGAELGRRAQHRDHSGDFLFAVDALRVRHPHRSHLVTTLLHICRAHLPGRHFGSVEPLNRSKASLLKPMPPQRPGPCSRRFAAP